MVLIPYIQDALLNFFVYLSTDTKPPNPVDNICILERDTGIVFHSEGGEWKTIALSGGALELLNDNFN